MNAYIGDDPEPPLGGITAAHVSMLRRLQADTDRDLALGARCVALALRDGDARAARRHIMLDLLTRLVGEDYLTASSLLGALRGK